MAHKDRQLVIFPHIIIERPQKEVVDEAVEPFERVTHQQLARLAALLLLIGFVVFLLGYSTGKHTQNEYASLLPSEFYDIFYTPEVIQGGESSAFQGVRVATLQEAATLKSSFAHSKIIARTSRSVAGVEKTWYHVIQLQKGVEDD